MADSKSFARIAAMPALYAASAATICFCFSSSPSFAVDVMTTATEYVFYTYFYITRRECKAESQNLFCCFEFLNPRAKKGKDDLFVMLTAERNKHTQGNKRSENIFSSSLLLNFLPSLHYIYTHITKRKRKRKKRYKAVKFDCTTRTQSQHILLLNALKRERNIIINVFYTTT